jgi:hypothetical protein
VVRRRAASPGELNLVHGAQHSILISPNGGIIEGQTERPFA